MFLKSGSLGAAVPLASCVVLLALRLCVDAQRVRHHQEPPSTTATAGEEPQNLPLLPVGRQGGTEHHLLPVRDLETFEVDEVDMEKVTAEDEYLESQAQAEGILLPYRFAIPNDVAVTAQTHGVWEQSTNEDNSTTQVWRFRCRSRNAASLNLGFDRFKMPEGGSLHLYDPYSEETVGRSYTSRDNADHGELWTAILRSQEAVLEVDLPPGVPPDALELSLTKINVGYRGPAPDVTILPIRPRPLVSSGFGGFRRILGEGTDGGGDDATRALSGECNVDVVCDEGDGWRNEIRSVAVYSISGRLSCTGSMVNNVNMDQTPFFLTANHCNLDSSNAASLVVYWNYETSSCGGTPDGSLAHSQSGSTFRASYGPSDMTLMELDSLPDPSWNVTYAGWDARDITSYAGGVVAIHHPSVDEKRISHEYNATTTTAYFGTAVPGDGTHIRVIDWDVGTTEGGSSGSPLFDAATNRIVGQLHGGDARCGTDESDWYGRFYVSWTGGNTDSTRLCNWLDPKSSGTLFVDTYDPSIPMPRIMCVPSIGSIAQGEAARSVCTVSSQADFAGEVVLSASGLPTGIEVAFFPSSVSVPSGGEVITTVAVSVGNIIPMSSPGYVFDVEATYDGSEVERQGAGVIVVTQGQQDDAVYDTKLGAPHCWMVGPLCDSSDLLEGRGMMSGGIETHAPNTLDSCADGEAGTYNIDESMDRLVVRTVGNGDMVEGAEVEIEAHVYAYFNGASDRADFYYASDATDPTWVHIGTETPTGGGSQVITRKYFLPAGHLQAVRVKFSYMGSPTPPCSDGEYDEADDLAFAVGEAPSAAPSTAPSWEPSLSLSPSSSPSASLSPSTAPSTAPSSSPSASLSPSTAPSTAPSLSPSEAHSAAPSSSKIPSSDPSSSPSVVPSESPSESPSGQPSLSLSLSPSEAHSAAPSSSKIPSSDPSSSPSVVPSESPSESTSGQPSLSLSPSEAHSAAPSSSKIPSSDPSSSPSVVPSESPSESTSGQPSLSLSPSEAHSAAPSSSKIPSSDPSSSPSVVPSESPSESTSGQPSLSLSPSEAHSAAPSSSNKPSSDPSSSPSVVPSESPSESTSGQPSLSLSPSEAHSAAPSSSKMPSSDPSSSPSVVPSESPSESPSGQPSLSLSPSEAYSSAPTSSTVPSSLPSSLPSAEPSPGPSPLPSPISSADPSSVPSADPSTGPSVTISSMPSPVLSSSPSGGASGEPSGPPSAVPSVRPSTSPSKSTTPWPTLPIIELQVFRCRIHNRTDEVLVSARLQDNIEDVPMIISWSSDSSSGMSTFETNKKGRARKWLKYDNGTRIVATDPMTSTVELVTINGTDYWPFVDGAPATETCIVDIYG